MNHRHLLGGLALALVAGSAAAGPQQLGTGTGTYTFSDNRDRAWYVTLGPGTYDFTSSVVSDGFDLTNVWLSYSKDMKCCHANDIDQFDMNSPTNWSEAYGPLTLTQTTDVYVDVNTNLGKLTNGHYDGRLLITSVPEPGSVPLLLAGLGLVGLVARRRSTGR